MLESFLITSRETLEAGLVVGITLTYLVKSKQRNLRTAVFAGIAAGILGSILFAYLFSLLAGGFSGTTEEVFEGVTMLVGSVLLTSMIVWMTSQRHHAQAIQQEVQARSSQNISLARTGIFLLIFFAIIREGVETVIFLNATKYATGVSLLGGILGVAAAIVLCIAIFLGTRKLPLKHVFKISSVLLLLFAAGLFSHSISEFTEAGVFPETFVLYDTTALLSTQSTAGSFLQALVGYEDAPRVLESAAYTAYLVFACCLFYWQSRKVLVTTTPQPAGRKRLRRSRKK